ncbi:MAG: hypothetical protein AAFV87_12135 [Pseudomonadota bacterium]
MRQPVQAISIAAITLTAPFRPSRIEMRIAAPATGSDLPIVQLSVGDGRSL